VAGIPRGTYTELRSLPRRFFHLKQVAATLATTQTQVVA
jgi:hypothetical protein